MTIQNALAHIEAARNALTLEAYLVEQGLLERADHFTLAVDLKRVDAAIGPAGESIFARIADRVMEAYVEILAAQKCLKDELGEAGK